MAILQTGQSFSSGDQVTSQKLMDIANLATFDDPADGSTIIVNSNTYGVPGGDGKLKVKSGGITFNELATDSVVTAKIQDDAVTSDKLAHISNLNVLGNVSGSTAAPIGVEIKDEDDMASDLATALATQQSIKAYVDNQISNVNTNITGLPSKYTEAWTNSLGGVAIANQAIITVTHNLGTTDVTWTMYANTSASDIGAASIHGHDIFTSGRFGALVKNLTTNTITFELAANGYSTANGFGATNTQNFSGSYVKVVIVG